MNKSEYLKQPIVVEYIEFISKLLDEELDFSHSYFSYGFTKKYKFTSVFEALIQYEWKFTYTDLFTKKKFSGVSLKDNKLHLAKFKDGLGSSIANHDYKACINWCSMILDWGKVLNGNKSKVVDLGPNIIEYLTNCRKMFMSTNLPLDGKYKVFVNGKNKDVIMSAGFTKIYSLLLEDFIIYDGRVGAALGLLEKYFYNTANKPQSKLLSFHYGNAKTSNNKKSKLNRNPSEGAFKVSVLSPGNVHTRDNLKANWILQEIVKKSKSKFSVDPEPLRAIECALFMIGYHLPKNDMVQTQLVEEKSSTVKGDSKKQMTNHDFLFRHIQDSSSRLPKKFSYDDLLKLAKSVFPKSEVSLSGQIYASLKLIHNYCSIAVGDIHAYREFKELSDPRKFARVVELKNNWLFQID